LARAPHPIANSLCDAVYQWLPNDTDFTHFKRAGIAGLNFAFIDGAAAYHSPLDTAENLSEASLQHHGSYALALARDFGNSTPPGSEAPGEPVYFNPWGGLLLCYDRHWVLPLTGLALLGCLVLLVAGLRYGCLRWKPLVQGILAAPAWVLLISGVATLIVVALVNLTEHWGITTVLPPRGENLGSPLMTLALWNVVLALMALVAGMRPTIARMGHAAVGQGFLWLGLCLASSLFLPGGSFLFIWPLLFALPGHAMVLLCQSDRRLSRPQEGFLLLSGLPAIVLLAPAIYLFFIALIPHLAIGVLVTTLLAALTMGLLLPQLQLVALRRPWALPASGLLGAVACFVAGRLASALGS
jgi:hypothetical protein